MNNLLFLPKDNRDFCFIKAPLYLNEMNCTMHCPSILSICVPIQFSFINSLPISYFFSLICRYRNNEHENDSTNSLGLDFKRVVYAGEFNNDEGMKDNDLSPNLLRLVV